MVGYNFGSDVKLCKTGMLRAAGPVRRVTALPARAGSKKRPGGRPGRGVRICDYWRIAEGDAAVSTANTRRTLRSSRPLYSTIGVSTTCFDVDEAWIIMPSPT